MLYYKAYKSGMGRWPRRLHHISGHQPENDHHKVDQILEDGRAVLSSAESGDDEEDGEPDDEFAAHEHACRAEDEGQEARAVGLLLHHQLGRVVEGDIFRV